MRESIAIQPHQSHRWRIGPRERTALLVLGDFLAGLLALAGALYLWASRSGEYLDPSLDFLRIRPPIWFFLLPVIWIVLLLELYDVRRTGNFRETVSGIMTAALIGFVLYTVVYFVFTSSFPRFGVAVFLLLVAPLTFVWRLIYNRLFTLPALMRRMLLVGGGASGLALLEVIADLPQPPFFVVGVIDDDPRKIGTKIEGYHVIGGSDYLLKIVEKERVSDIVVAISGEMGGGMFQALLDVQESGVEISGMQTVYEDLLLRVPILHLDSDWILRSFVEQSRVSSFYMLEKRLLDIVGGFDRCAGHAGGVPICGDCHIVGEWSSGTFHPNAVWAW